MNWDELLGAIHTRGLPAIEEIYMENYGHVMAVQRPEFSNRYFRCAYGVFECRGIRIETFLFPSDGHLSDFMEIIGDNPWWIRNGNIVLHFPESDPAVVDEIISAVTANS